MQSDANMVGYWRRPDLTEQTIRDGWMWTGDIAVWDQDGYIFIVDRAKDMIISGGENIYPKEIENAIYEHNAVAECAVFGIPDEKWGELVTALVVTTPGSELTEADVITWTKQKLAGYKCPKKVEFRDELARTATGKLQKFKLRAPFWEGLERQVN